MSRGFSNHDNESASQTIMNTKPKYQFWSERAYARDAVTIPRKVQRKIGIARTWTISDIVAELRREPGSCPHIEHPLPPRLIY